MRLRRSSGPIAVACAIFALSACHPRAVIDTDPKASVGGTIAGIVRSGETPVVGRHVTAVNTTTGARFEATTGANGGYTIKVPEGTYRLEVELKAGEKVTKQPAETKINKGDLDTKRDFVIAAGG